MHLKRTAHISYAKLLKISDDIENRSKLNKKDQNRSNSFGFLSGISDLCRKKVMEEKKWITTEQMLENLKNDANHEHEYYLWLCNGFVTSTRWVVYDSKKQMIGHTRN